jgi:N-acetyl sugar amidotransferase
MDKQSGFGKPMFRNIHYCLRCCMPQTQDDIEFDEMGICLACKASEEKMHIDWAQRERELRLLLEDAKAKSGNNYDCIVPISGGKDSTFQLHVLTKIYGMKPLAVTFNHNWYSETGWYNLQNSLEQFNVDHIMFTPNRDLINRLARRSLYKIGDSCWHCHSGVGSFPLQIAVKFNIPLIIWGESVAEESGRAGYQIKPMKFDRNYFVKISSKVEESEMVGDGLTSKDLYPFKIPSAEECGEMSILGIHLGNYIFWDGERQVEFVKKEYNWQETDVEGAYKKYKSVECFMAGMHDFTKYLKRGFGRGSNQASIDVRAGLMTREEGFEFAKKYDAQRPNSLDYYLKITGLSEEEFLRVMEEWRLPELKTEHVPITTKDPQSRSEPYIVNLLKKYREKESE